MNLQQIKQLDEQYYMPVFGTRQPVCFTHGEGAYLFDTEGKRYTDFLAGIAVNALGYSDEGFKTTLKNQVDALLHTSNYFYNEQQALLAQALCEKTGYQKAFFGNSGAEANECAIKLAKKYAFNKGIKDARFVSFQNSFHGRTLATLAATGQEKFHTAFSPSVYEYTYLTAGDAAAAEKAITPDTCGVILEVIQAEGGVLPMQSGFLKLVRAFCDRHDVPLIIDEVQTGAGRTGSFLAQEQLGIKADITTLAKALGNGIPIGACLANEKLAAAFVPGDHGSTFGGNHLACAAGLYVTQAIDEKLLAQVQELGAYLKAMLQKLQEVFPQRILDVRGMGLLLGAELPDAIPAPEVKTKLLERGFVIGTAGANTLRFVPPFVITKEDVDNLISALKDVLLNV